MLSELELSDLDKRYRGTVAIITDKNSKETFAFSLERVEQLTNMQVLNGWLLDGDSPTKLNLDNLVIHPITKSRAFLVKGIPYFYSRSPQRQYRKGFCRENSSFSELNFFVNSTNEFSDFYVWGGSFGKPRNRSSPKPLNMLHMVDGIIKTEYSNSFEKSLAKIENDEKCFADCIDLQHTLVYVGHEVSGIEYILYLRDTPIATISKTTITLTHSAFEQEVRDFCSKYSLQFSLRGC